MRCQIATSKPVTSLWLDTEFNGFGGEFISAALVAEDGRYWYRAVACADPIPWVATHVMPVVGTETTTMRELQSSLCAFLGQFDRVNIIADWPDDVAYFCRLMAVQPHGGNILTTPPLSFEIKTWLNGVGQSEVPHNALADARALLRSDLAGVVYVPNRAR